MGRGRDWVDLIETGRNEEYTNFWNRTMKRISEQRRKRRCTFIVLKSLAAIVLLSCLATFIYTAVVLREIQNMKEVEFSAKEIETLHSSDRPETVIFKSVTHASTDAYHPGTGHFVVPVNGRYIFMTKICSYVTSTYPFSDLYLAISVNDIVRGTTRVDHTTVNKTVCADASAIEFMRKGEHAYVTVYSSNTNCVINTADANSFFGSRLI